MPYGFEALNSNILRVQPMLVIHGHQRVDKESKLGQTRIIGVHGYKLIKT
ncbi:MAG: hypothetical protein QME90_10930 [Thermodesulfobacteriota bacterium]|nr:hypothetical protein [Thermodesulfobacteriota bacterium]